MNNWLVIGLTFLAFALCCVMEIRRRNKRQLGWRLIASALLCTSLACLIIRPTYRIKNTRKKGIATVLLTPGFNRDSLSALGDSLHLFSADDELIAGNSTLNIRPLISKSDLSTESEPVHILGYGINKTDSTLLTGLAIKFHPAKPAGLIRANWPSAIRSGEPFTFAGTYRNQSDKPVKLLLDGMGTRLDSVEIAPKQTQNFTLQNKPPLTGPALFQLVTVQAGDTLERAPLPFQVGPKKTLTVLVLASSPGFENRFLKNWLSAEGYAFALRSTISKQKISQEFVNLARTDLTKLNAGTLAKFDVLVADAAAIKQMNAAENSAIKTAVWDKGLGLVISADSSKINLTGISSSFPLSHAEKNTRKMQLRLNDRARRITLDDPGLIIRPAAGTQPLLRDENGRVRAAVALSGTGKMVMNTLGETYPLMLAGDKAGYGGVWTALIGQAARRNKQREMLWTEPQISRVDEPMQIMLKTSPAQMPEIFAGKISIAPQQSPEIPYRWSGKYWPRETGWQRFRTASGTEIQQYIFDKGDFAGISARERADFTQVFSQSAVRRADESHAPENYTQKELPRLVFFLMILLCWAYLWTERKFA